MAKKKKTFEESLTRLEDIIDIIENSETSLDSSVKLYKEGIELSAFCMESLNQAEKEVEILTKGLDDKFKKQKFGGINE